MADLAPVPGANHASLTAQGDTPVTQGSKSIAWPNSNAPDLAVGPRDVLDTALSYRHVWRHVTELSNRSQFTLVWLNIHIQELYFKQRRKRALPIHFYFLRRSKEYWSRYLSKTTKDLVASAMGRIPYVTTLQRST